MSNYRYNKQILLNEHFLKETNTVRCGMGSSWPRACDGGNYILFNFKISDPD